MSTDLPHGKGDERVLLNEQGVLVTSARFVAPSYWFDMSDVTATRIWVEPDDDSLSPFALLLSGGTICSAALLLVVSVAHDDYVVGPCIRIVAAPIIALGAGFVALAVREWKRTRTLVSVSVSTASGEARVLARADRAFASRVERAITEAIVARTSDQAVD
jgi:hypothetical protein